jgi:hypothetical protein
VTDKANTLNVKKPNYLLKILARASAWALLAGVLVLIVSGWGITQTGIIYSLTGGLVDRKMADAIHRAANAPLTFLFLSHVLINIRLMVSPKKPVSVWMTNIVLILIGMGLTAITIYMEYFRMGG